MNNKHRRLCFVYGLEIESIVNSSRFNYPIGRYHCGLRISKYWTTQSDSSIRVSDVGERWLSHRAAVEFVTVKLRGIAGINAAIAEFRNLFNTDNLDEAVYFGNSCGVHIHIGIQHPYKIERTLRDTYEEMRDCFFSGVTYYFGEDSQILFDYFREHANTMDKYDYYIYERGGISRYREFNISPSLQAGKGIEWRSPTLHGITTWEDFYKFWSVVIECLRILEKRHRLCFKYVEDVNIDYLFLPSLYRKRARLYLSSAPAHVRESVIIERPDIKRVEVISSELRGSSKLRGVRLCVI